MKTKVEPRLLRRWATALLLAVAVLTYPKFLAGGENVTEAPGIEVDACDHHRVGPPIVVGGAEFSASKRLGDATSLGASLVAVGKSHLSYFGVAVCSSALYVAPGEANDAVLFERADDAGSGIALEVYYHKPASAANLRWATRHFSEKNLEDGRSWEDLPDNIRESLERFNSLYRGVRSGDRYLLSYLPQSGMTLSLNAEPLGTVGADLPFHRRRELARLIYTVWFGRKAPFSRSMREELLTPLPPSERWRSDVGSCIAGPATPVADGGRRRFDGISEKEGDLLVSMGTFLF